MMQKKAIAKKWKKKWNAGSRQPNHPLCQDHNNIACCLFSAVSFSMICFKHPLSHEREFFPPDTKAKPFSDIPGNTAWNGVFVLGIFLISRQRF